MKPKRARASLLLVVIVASGCTIPDLVEIRNDAGFGVVIHACGVAERVGDGLSAEFRAKCLLPLEIEATSAKWQYFAVKEQEAVPGLGVPTPGGRRVKLSLRRDGTLAIISINEMAPDRERIPLRPE